MLAIFGGKTPAPKQVIEADPQDLRDAGLSWSKVGFLKDLAERVGDGRLDLKHLSELSDEDVVATLTEIKGVGRWTAEMFLIFRLGRPDIWAIDDLGLRNAVKNLYGIEPTKPNLIEVAEPWRPWRSVASWYLWRSLANTAPSLGNQTSKVPV